MKKALIVSVAVLTAAMGCNKPAGRYMIIPVREANDEMTLTIEKGGDTLYVADIRLALEGEKADYSVPLDLSHFGADKEDVHFSGIDEKTAWKLIGFSDNAPEIPE